MPFLNDLLEEIKAKFAEVDAKTDEINLLIKDYEKKLRHLKEELNAVMKATPSFKEFVVKIKDELLQYLPDGTTATIMGPYSIRSVYTIDFKIPNRKKEVYLTLVPMQFGKGIVHYETGKQLKKYASGSLGAANGFNNETKELTDIQDIIKLLKEQINQPVTNGCQ